MEIFTSLKEYLFLSLLVKDFSNTAIEILKKFFCHQGMQDAILNVSTENFLSTLQLMYMPDVD